MSQTRRNARNSAGVTHEFQTLLTSVLLTVDTLRTAYLPEGKQLCFTSEPGA